MALSGWDTMINPAFADSFDKGLSEKSLYDRTPLRGRLSFASLEERKEGRKEAGLCVPRKGWFTPAGRRLVYPSRRSDPTRSMLK
jgi:hypothetical protein